MNQREVTKWIIRCAVMALAFGYLYVTLDWASFGSLVAKADMRWVFGAWVMYGITTGLSIVRWHILLSECHAPMKWIRTAQLTMVGLFANTFLPGMMSGDVVKVYYSTRELPHIKPAVVMSVVMERLLGFIAMFLMSTLLILSRYEALTSETVTRIAVYFYFAFFTVVLVGVFLTAFKKFRLPFVDKLPWKKQVDEAFESYRFFMRHPLCFWGGLGLSCMAHFSLMTTFYFISCALGMNLDYWDLAAVLPLVALVTLIPTTPSGVGIREMAFKHFLVFAGMNKEASVALSLGGFFVILIWNMIGGLVYLPFRSAAPVALAEGWRTEPYRQGV